MDIRISLVGITDHHRKLTWPEGWPVPPEGAEIGLPAGKDGLKLSLEVRTVTWYPEGAPFDSEDNEPFIYVIVGRPRRTI